MKTLTFVLAVLVVFSSVVYGEMFRKTASDLYQESYQAQMQRLSGMSAAEIRAGEYRRIYERCDAHHNCGNLEGGSLEDGKGERYTLFTYVPVWR